MGDPWDTQESPTGVSSRRCYLWGAELSPNVLLSFNIMDKTLGCSVSADGVAQWSTLYERTGRPMDGPWPTVKNPWETLGQTMGNPWVSTTRYEAVGYPWKTHGRRTEDPWAGPMILPWVIHWPALKINGRPIFDITKNAWQVHWRPMGQLYIPVGDPWEIARRPMCHSWSTHGSAL